MSTLSSIRNLRLPEISRTTRIVGFIGVVAVSLSVTVALVGSHIYQKLTNNTVVAYFPTVVALYPGDKVQIMGVQIGTIDKIEPAGDQMKVTFHYRNRYRVSASTVASIVNPSLVASREIQLSPPDDKDPVLKDGAIIPIARTQVPVEWDDLRDQLSRVLTALGPTPQQPKGPLGEVIESLSDGLAGKGKQINDTLTALADAVTTVNEGRGDIFAVVRNLARFVNALRQNDQQFIELNSELAQFTNAFTNSDHELADTMQALDRLLPTARKFITDNGSTLAHDISNLSETTNALMQPEPRDGLETVLHVLPNQAVNAANTYELRAWRIGRDADVPQLRQPDGIYLQLDPGCQSARIPGVSRTVRPIPRACLGRDEIQLPALWCGPIRHGQHIAYERAIFGATLATSTWVQRHHRARRLVARHILLPRQPPARLDRCTRHAGRGPSSAVEQDAYTAIVVRAHSRPRYQFTDARDEVAGPAERCRPNESFTITE